MMDWFLYGDFGSAPANWPATIMGLLVALACGQVLAWVYMLTHTGLSYSRSFVNAMLLLPSIVSLVMMILSNNLVTAFGMMAVFAIVRFRNILRDTLDTAYILTSLVIGMAAGTQKYASAITGCALVTVVLLYLWYTHFGTRHRYDVIVNLHWARSIKDLDELTRVLERHSWGKATPASQRAHDGYEGTDISYRLLLRDSNRVDDLLNELRSLAGVSRVTSLAAENESEL